jgi:hypothetical protein
MRALAAAAVLASACAPVLSGLQPAKVTPHQKWHVSAGGDVGVAAGGLFGAIGAGVDLAQKVKDGGTLSEEERGKAYDAALALLLSFPVSAAWNVQGAYGFAPDFEVALRWAGTAWRASGRWQFLDAGQAGIDGSVGLGLGLYTLGIPLADQLPIAKISDFRRFEVDAPILFGWSGDLGHFWFGPRLMLARYGSNVEIDLGGGLAGELAKLEGTAFYAGGQIGAALGWKYVWLAAELTVTWLSGGGRLDVVGNVREVPTSGLVVNPSFAVIARF